MKRLGSLAESLKADKLRLDKVVKVDRKRKNATSKEERRRVVLRMDKIVKLDDERRELERKLKKAQPKHATQTVKAIERRHKSLKTETKRLALHPSQVTKMSARIGELVDKCRALEDEVAELTDRHDSLLREDRARGGEEEEGQKGRVREGRRGEEGQGREEDHGTSEDAGGPQKEAAVVLNEIRNKKRAIRRIERECGIKLRGLSDTATRIRKGEVQAEHREDRDGRGERAARHLDRQALHAPRAGLPGSHPGGQHGAHARGREVRLQARLQVLHVRHLVDPAGDHEGHRRPGADHPRSRPHDRGHQQGRAHDPPARAGGGHATRRSTRSPTSSTSTEDKVKGILKAAQQPISLDRPIGEDEDSSLGDFVEDTKVVSPSDYASFKLLQGEINEVLAELDPREEKIIRLALRSREGPAPMTLEEVGAIFGVTRERVRQIEKKAIGKLRHYKRRSRLKGYIDLP